MPEDTTKEDLIEKYSHTDGMIYFFRPNMKTPEYKVILARRQNDYVIATSKGEEFPLSYESADKVRDIFSGNMTGLDEYESKLFKRFSDERFLKAIAEDSMYRHMEKKGVNMAEVAYASLMFNTILNPSFLMPLREKYTKEEKEALKVRKESIEKGLEELLGFKVKADDKTFTNLLMKFASDESAESKRFMKGALKKKR
jgi:hypothetical protein